MECTVLKAFPLSYDGIKAEMVAVDAVVEVPDSLVEGLVAAGYVAKGTVSASADLQPVVSEPDGSAKDDAGDPEKVGEEQPVVSESKTASGKTRATKDHQVQ